MATPPSRIILSRTDNIGDVVLTLPMAGVIKQRYPRCEVVFLAQEYVAPIIDACADVDGIIDWTALSRGHAGSVADALAAADADAIIHVFPNPVIARAARSAGIPVRIGTRRRWYHWLTCNRLVPLTRRASSAHESELNVRLLAPLGIPSDQRLADLASFHSLRPSASSRRAAGRWLDDGRFMLVLHPGSRGNGKEWPEQHYLDLIDRLPGADYGVLLTGTAEEGSRFARLASHARTVDTTGQLDLAELLAVLSMADGIVASGTGPLHVAAACGTRTLGLFPTLAGPVGANRWGPLGPRAQFLAFQNGDHQCGPGASCSCMAGIDADQVARVIEGWRDDDQTQ